MLKNYPEMTDAQISKLLGTTKPTINSVRDKTHWNSSNIKPRNPSQLGLCGVAELEKAIAIARAKAGTTHAANKTDDGQTDASEGAEAPAETQTDTPPALPEIE